MRRNQDCVRYLKGFEQICRSETYRRQHEYSGFDEGKRRARPSRLIDINRLPLNKIEDTSAGGLRLDALCANVEASSLESDFGIRVAAIAEYGDQRRQSAAKNALLLFLRCRYAVQQTRTVYREKRQTRF